MLEAITPLHFNTPFISQYNISGQFIENVWFYLNPLMNDGVINPNVGKE
jgi:hypothetical protein